MKLITGHTYYDELEKSNFKVVKLSRVNNTVHLMYDDCNSYITRKDGTVSQELQFMESQTNIRKP